MNMKLVLASVATVVALTGCASTQVNYGDAQSVETLNKDFGSTDLQMIADKMVTDMLSFPVVVQLTQNRRPVMFVDKIRNKTQEHIDTESITDTIQNKLINSGKFRFVDMTAANAMADQLNYQKNSGLVNQATSVKAGGHIGAEYMLNGNLSSIVKNVGGKSDVYYKFTLKLQNVQTGIVEWTSEKEIRKSAKRSAFGL
ncbi:penicillin-binding protein activator LpoB [Acinetobacter wuhouensis]|uniref:Penicillin-binding protein activator LpoB n=1 Tax=Acinetobacter wuhouensis TaxID=1879050 RepID=A0A385BZV0_9GAMM|nr:MULTISPECIES: penicillin-binding protein activator LpoB [Acinetobacter]AXQ20960.1 penicillin-binding protein activator LpoB [Acinetobacter wuhouensis]AYO55845.1 penicillin-binding protein activator LpoB [Acinetobacter wuhouensis]RZG45522.1 penicillin-binding protein activator LpoB [Acinetobacter wuhouensis]RZG72706.1 penicillin-binding protein activator LpoB [Acinetobacter wuhouensis]RZG74327.1 penicillin-binding protein activator LpoB [Acinetobacter sp. WCHAc060025]